MNQPPRKQNNHSNNNQNHGQQRRRPQPRRREEPVDIWRAAAPLPDLTPIQGVNDADAFLRSLGDPPLGDRSVIAGHFISAVVERAAAVATALALSADLLATDPED